MKKRAICLIVALLLIVGCCGNVAFAKSLDFTQLLTLFSKQMERLEWGNKARSLAEAVGYEDVHHIISANGESVLLKADTLSTCISHIWNKWNYFGSYQLSYQWYMYDTQRKVILPIQAATDATFDTAPMEDVGINIYFYQIKVYKKLQHTFYMIHTQFSVPYVVAYSGLPTVYIDTPDRQRIMSKEEWMEGATIQIVGGPNCEYSLDLQEIRIKGRGSASWRNSSKNSYSFKFGKKQDLFNIGKDKTWALIGNFSDKTLLRNWLAAELDQEVFALDGEWDVTQRHVDLVLNGEYRGTYTLATPIRLGDKRIDVPDISDEISEDQNNDGEINYYDAGFVVEINHSLDEAYNFNTDIAVIPISLTDPDLDEYAETNEAIYQHIKGVIQTAENALYSENFTDPEAGYSKYIDVDSFIDHYLIQELSKNSDGHFYRSIYMYYQPKDGKLHIASSWDFDIAFGNNYTDDCDLTDGFRCVAGWYAKMFEDPVFVEKLVARWNEVRPQLESFAQSRIQEQADAIRVSAQLNFCKWPILGTYVISSPRDFYTRWTYQAEVDYLTEWLSDRIAWLDSAFRSMA